MSHYTLDQLIDLWRREQLTAEQMIGQLLQVLKEQERRLREIARNASPSDDRVPSVAQRDRQV